MEVLQKRKVENFKAEEMFDKNSINVQTSVGCDSAKIENIEVDWQSGSVSIASHSESTFLLSEKTGDGISDDFRVHWWLEGTTLHVKYAASGASMQLFGAWHKDLTFLKLQIQNY